VIVHPDNLQFNTSAFSGIDSLMSVELKIADASAPTQAVLDSLVHWKNIYGVDKSFNPIDKNLNINLNQLIIHKSRLNQNKTYAFSVRYRDHNLKWSSWSDSAPFNTNGLISGLDGFNDLSTDDSLDQNYPNPFSHSTIFPYQIRERGNVSFFILDFSGKEIRMIDSGLKSTGKYNLEINSEKLENGIYFLRMETNQHTITRKMIVAH
jgi:hypothetical protein